MTKQKDPAKRIAGRLATRLAADAASAIRKLDDEASRLRHDRDRKIVDAVRSGASVTEVASATGLSRQRVYSLYQAAEVSRASATVPK